MRHFLRGSALAVVSVSTLWRPARRWRRPLRIGVITFLSGPAAGPFGVPARMPPTWWRKR